MMNEPHIDHEVAIRHFVSNIIVAIESKPDALQNKLVKIPDVADAIFDSASITEISPQLKAYRFVEEFVSLSQGSPTQGLVEQFFALEKLLIWGHASGYNTNNVGQTFLDNYCHALLTGPEGPLKCAAPLGAFVLFGPDTFYKDHSHTPNEVYLALTGGAEWRVDDNDWQQLEAGEIIFIASEATHAIRTHDNPVLTFSFWLEPGDIGAIRI